MHHKIHNEIVQIWTDNINNKNQKAACLLSVDEEGGVNIQTKVLKEDLILLLQVALDMLKTGPELDVIKTVILPKTNQN